MLLKYFSLLCAALLVVTMESSAQLTLKMPYKPVSVENVNGTTVFNGVSTYGEAGQPRLPAYSVTFLLPFGTDPDSVSVSIENPIDSTVSGKWYVAPATPPMKDGDSVVTTGEYPKDMSVYGKNSFFPASWTGNVIFGKLRKNQLVEIEINPCRYNPVTGEMKMLVGGVLTISYKEVKSGTMAIPPVSARDNLTIERLRKLIVNPEALNYTPQTDKSQNLLKDAPEPQISYAIITTNAIVNESDGATKQLQAYINYLQAAGYNVILATENKWGGGIGDAAAENIRAWLKNNWDTDNIHYVLLIGNPDTGKGDVPMKTVYPEQKTKNSKSGPAAPTDFYYAELSGNWDVDGDGHYGEYVDDFDVDGGADRDADIAVGRIPYYGNIDDLEKILRKSIDYANSIDREWRKSIMLPMVPFRGDCPNYQLGEQITDLCRSQGFAFYRLYNEQLSYETSYPDVVNMYPPMDATPCTEEKVLDAWTHNYFGLVTWSGHGGETGANYIFSSDNAGKLDADDKHPSMVFSTSCSNADPEYDDNLAYSILLKGGITVVAGSAMTTYWGESDFKESWSNGGFGYSYTKALMGNDKSGNALNYVKARDVVEFDETAWRHCCIFNLYGCPELSLNCPCGMPKAPTHLEVTSEMQDFLTLRWDDNADDETDYSIEYAYNVKGPFHQFHPASSNNNSALVYVNFDTKLFFRVRAVNSRGPCGEVYSCYSNIDSGTVNKFLPAPNLTSYDNNIPENQINLKWQPSNGATSYIVKRSPVSGGPYVTIGFTTETSFTTSSLIPDNDYYFVVEAVNDAGHSPNSNELKASCKRTLPAAPSNLRATASGVIINKINLSWNDNSIDEDGFHLLMAPGPIGPWNDVPITIGKNQTTASVRYDANTTYYFRLYAYNSEGKSGYSNDASARTLSSLIISEAEGVTLSGDAKVNDNHKNASDNKFVDGLGNTTNAKITFTVKVAAAGTYGILLWYSAGNGESTNMGLSANNGPVTNLDFPGTNDWDTWAELSAAVTLNSGINTIEIQSTSSSTQSINLDYLQGLDPIYLITASADANGSISPEGIVQVELWESPSFTITPNSGSVVENVTVDGKDQGAITSYKFKNVYANHTISATFKVNQYTITASADDNGTIDPQGDVLVNSGESRTFTIVPNKNYVVDNVVIDGWDNKGAITSYTFPAVTANHTISATFKAIQYTITASAGANGSISPSGSITVNGGAVQGFTFIPKGGYQVSDVKVDNQSQGAIISYTFNNVTSNHTISVTFTTQSNPKTEAENAALSGGANKNTNHKGYGGTGFVDGFYNSTTAQATFTVYEQFSGMYYVKLHYSAGNGTSTNVGLYVNNVKVKNITCSGTQNWDCWADQTETVALNAGNNTITYKAETSSNSCINLDYIIVDYKGAAPYTITASAGANGSISPSGSVAVNSGENRTFTIVPNSGYVVSDVTVNGWSVGAITTVTLNNVTTNYAISVTFKQNGSWYEAENATFLGTAKANNNHSGYSGAAFVDGFYYSTTAQATFSVNVPSDGSYKLVLHYSAGNGTSSNTGFYVNGTKIKNITCASTSNWDTWADEQETVTLNAGNNTIAYKAESSSNACINLDVLTISQ